ncbi:MAG: class I SAM-dependent methyltransferase [bacterium]
MQFKDYYSKQSKEYLKYRPTYPSELFQFLNSIVNEHKLAVDCASGNGQAAIGIAGYFDKVIALDASTSQIENAIKNDKVEYRIAKAEATGIDTRSADLVTIATAIHWVDLDLFYNEVKRILNDKGIIAIWTYSTTPEIDPAIDDTVNLFSKEVLDIHWDRGIEQIWKFEELPFPFEIIDSPEFEIKRDWTCEDFLNYIFTWSSVHRYIDKHNENPVKILEERLKDIWGEIKREVKLKVMMKAGRKL